MTNKKPSSYYSCNPTKELAKYTGLTVAGLVGLTVIWLVVSAVASIGSKPAPIESSVCFEMRPSRYGCMEN